MLATSVVYFPGARHDDDAIECDDLDAQHRLWLRSYLDNCRSMLQEEQQSPSADLLMVTYLKRQIQRYEALLKRFCG